MNTYCMATMAAFGAFDFESEPIINITLLAADKAGQEERLTLQLEILNVNDPPSVGIDNDSTYRTVCVG